MRYSFPAIIPAILIRLRQHVAGAWHLLRTPLLCWLYGIKSGRGVNFDGPVFLRTHGHEIVIGDQSHFVSSGFVNAVGLTNPTILDTQKGGKITIGKYCGFSSPVISSKSSVTIGDRVMVGGNVRIFDHNYHSLDPLLRGTGADMSDVRTRPVHIDDDVFIGTNAIILKGTHLGPRSIIAAGSVVFGLDVPADSMVKGNPAVVVSTRANDR